jgi:glycosyltransferase involved in cell wall biosynthesis
MPKVAVITPTYNQERYIAECIRSVIAQTFQDWEMVVVDDGSTDGTVEQARSVNDPRVRVIALQHRGLQALAETYNAGLAHSTAPLVAILEGDDLWKPRKLEIQVPLFDDPEVILAACEYEQITASGAVIDVVDVTLNPAAVRNEPVGLASAWMLRPQDLTFVFPLTVVIRRVALDRIGGFQQPDYLDVVDLPTFLRLGLEGKWRYVHEVLASWRRHERSTTISRLPRILSGAYRLVAEFTREYRDRLPVDDGLLDDIGLRWEYFEADRAMALSVLLAKRGDYSGARRAADLGRLFRLRIRTRLATELGSLFARVHLNPALAYSLLGKGGSVARMRLPGGESMMDDTFKPEEIVRHDFAPRIAQRLRPDIPPICSD